METKLVVAGKFGPVVKQESSRRYIDKEPVEVPLTSYYLRRIADGELVEVSAPKAKVKEEGK
jgi:hypothetical protein